MINQKYFIPSEALINEYQAVFQDNDDRKIFAFLNKYLAFIESDDKPRNRFFLMEDPLKSYEESKRFMDSFNDCICNYLERLIRRAGHPQKRTVPEGDVACFLGIAYEYGIFQKPVNEEMAFYYYTIAAQLNSELGTLRLAQCYERGLGTSKSLEKARYFFRCAAKLGLVDGLHVYGCLLLHGYLGCERNIELGLHYMSLAALKASKQYPYPLYDIGQWYEGVVGGQNAAADDSYALDVYQRGCELGDPSCLYRMAKAYESGALGCKVSPEKAFHFYKLAAKRGQIDAQLMLTEIYYVGAGKHKKQSPTQSYFWALKAATKGSGSAAFIIGEYTMRGFGTKKDILLSLMWFIVSNSLGYDEAIKRIIELKNEVKRQDSGPFLQPSCCSLFCL